MKTMKWSGVFLVVALLFVFAGEGWAFCVHNKSDRPMRVAENIGAKAFKEFKADLSPGQDACCHWSNKDCNKDGGKGDTVGFSVYYNFNEPTTVCKDVKIPACSDLDIVGSNGNYRCIPHGLETCN